MKILILFLSLLVLGCSSSEKTPKTPSEELVFTFERTACYGTCPEYTLKAYLDGSAELIGTKNTEFIGTFTCKDCDEDMIRSVVNKAEEIKFWDLNELYGEGVADLPSTITTMYMRPKGKSVTNILDGPEKLKELESLIFDLYFKRVWIKKET